MKTSRWLRSAGLALLVLCGAGAATAQVCRFDARPTDPAAGERLLQQLRQKSCLGSEADADPLTQQVRQRLGSEAQPGGALALPDVLVLLRDHARTQAAAAPSLAEAWQGLAREIESLQNDLPDPAAAEPPVYVAAAEKRLSPKWSAFTGTGGPIQLDGRSVAPIVPVACDAAGQCAELLARIDLVRSLNLMNALLDHLQRPLLQQQLAAARVELERWQAYRRDSQHQYFWELWLNGRLMANDKELCPREGGSYVGFCSVPTSQWIVAHPDVGVRWARGATQSAELKPALLIDLVGRHYLSWENDRSARIGRQWGWSLAAAYAEVDGRAEWAYGPRLHYNGYNLAVTRSPGGHWGLTISMNLADRYFERKAEYIDPLRNLDKPALLQLLAR